MLDIHIINLGLVNCYLIKDEGDYILIDTGMKRHSKKILSFLETNSISPEQIGLIIITHCHADHVGSLPKLKEKTHAKILIHEMEADKLRSGISAEVKPVGLLKLFINKNRKRTVSAVNPDIVMQDNFSLEEYGIKGKVIHTAGHTKGSISVIANNSAFVGDIAMKFPLTFSYKPNIAQDMDKVFSSWKKIIDNNVKNIYPSHGKPFDVQVMKNILQ